MWLVRGWLLDILPGRKTRTGLFMEYAHHIYICRLYFRVSMQTNYDGYLPGRQREISSGKFARRWGVACTWRSAPSGITSRRYSSLLHSSSAEVFLLTPVGTCFVRSTRQPFHGLSLAGSPCGGATTVRITSFVTNVAYNIKRQR